MMGALELFLKIKLKMSACFLLPQSACFLIGYGPLYVTESGLGSRRFSPQTQEFSIAHLENV